MPCANYICEFCENKTEEEKTFRRDALGGHVKAKHMQQIKDMILKEYVERDGDKTHTTLQRMMNGLNPPIYSELYENAEYYFGVKPNLFLDDDTKAQMSYKASQLNMDAHEAFLKELMNSITLIDMMACNVQIVMRSPEVIELKKKVRESEKMIMALEDDAEKNQGYIESLKQDIQDFRDLGDVESSIAEMKKQIDYYRHGMNRTQRELADLRETYERYREQSQKEYTEKWESLRKETLNMETQLYETDIKYRDMEHKMKQKINDGVAKELEKLRKEKEKEKEKAKKEKRKAKEKLKEAMMLAKLKAKNMKKAKSSSSDSDSSDSDSDSSDSDSD